MVCTAAAARCLPALQLGSDSGTCVRRSRPGTLAPALHSCTTRLQLCLLRGQQRGGVLPFFQSRATPRQLSLQPLPAGCARSARQRAVELGQKRVEKPVPSAHSAGSLQPPRLPADRYPKHPNQPQSHLACCSTACRARASASTLAAWRSCRSSSARTDCRMAAARASIAAPPLPPPPGAEPAAALPPLPLLMPAVAGAAPALPAAAAGVAAPLPPRRSASCALRRSISAWNSRSMASCCCLVSGWGQGASSQRRRQPVPAMPLHPAAWATHHLIDPARVFIHSQTSPPTTTRHPAPTFGSSFTRGLLRMNLARLA